LFDFSLTLTLVQLFFFALAPPDFFPGRAPDFDALPLSLPASLPFSTFLAYTQKINKDHAYHYHIYLMADFLFNNNK